MCGKYMNTHRPKQSIYKLKRKMAINLYPEENFQLILYKGLICLLYKDNLKMFKKIIYYFKIGQSIQAFHR